MTNEEYYALHPERTSLEKNNETELLNTISNFPDMFADHVLYNIAVTLGRISDTLERLAENDEQG